MAAGKLLRAESQAGVGGMGSPGFSRVRSSSPANGDR